jgi:hypothetical protein
VTSKSQMCFACGAVAVDNGHVEEGSCLGWEMVIMTSFGWRGGTNIRR